MDEKELKLVEDIKADIQKAFDLQFSDLKAQLDKNDKSGEENDISVRQDFEKINESIAKLEGNSEALTAIKESVDKLNEIIVKQGETIDQFSHETNGKSTISEDDFTLACKQALLNGGFQIDKDDKGNETVSMGGAGFKKLGDFNGVKPEFKAAHIITSADVTGLAIPTDFGVMGRDEIPPNTNDHVTEFFQTRPTSRATQMSLIIEYDLEGAPAIRAENTAVGLVSMKLKSQEFKIFTAGVKATISWEENDDVPELIGRLKEIVPDQIKQLLDSTILTVGGDNSAAPWGAMNSNSGTVFNALEYAGIGAGTANYVDLAMWMQDQCQTADYEGNGIYMGQKMQKVIASLKSTTNDAVLDSRITRANGVAVNLYGMAVKKSRIMENQFLVSVTNKNRIGIRQNIQVVSGFDQDDLTNLRITFVFYIRYAYGSQNVNANIWSNSLDADLVIINEAAAASLTRIQGYATGSDATAMTIQMMANTGATDVIPANLAAYKVAVAAEVSIADLAALQVVIDTVNAA